MNLVPCFTVPSSYTQSVGFLGREITPSQGRYVNRTTQTLNKRTQVSMPRVGFEPKVPEFEGANKVHALDRAATVTDTDLLRVLLYIHNI
jgi:hypothetical protein